MQNAYLRFHHSAVSAVAIVVQHQAICAEPCSMRSTEVTRLLSEQSCTQFVVQ